MTDQELPFPSTGAVIAPSRCGYPTAWPLAVHSERMSRGHAPLARESTEEISPCAVSW
jgi:hypothetical protein